MAVNLKERRDISEKILRILCPRGLSTAQSTRNIKESHFTSHTKKHKFTGYIDDADKALCAIKFLSKRFYASPHKQENKYHGRL